MTKYKFLIVPIILWFTIQTFKTVYDSIEHKKLSLRRFMGAGGMPSSHSAVVMSLAVLIGKNEGLNSPIFALSAIFAFITMYDAAGVRRAVGKQARILNDIINNQNLTNAEKLQEMTGHTPIQVLCGAFLGFVVGMVC